MSVDRKILLWNEGVLGLHSGETGFFDEEEMKLLHAGSLHSAANGEKV